MRHAMIAIAKAFIMASRAFADAESALAENSDHSVETEKAHYALKFGDVTRLTNFTVCQGRWVARQWQAVLGMSGPPPRPLKERAMFEDDDLSTRVMKLVEAKLAAELPSIMENAIKIALPALIATSVSSSLGKPPLYLSYQLLTFNNHPQYQALNRLRRTFYVLHLYLWQQPPLRCRFSPHRQPFSPCILQTHHLKLTMISRTPAVNCPEIYVDLAVTGPLLHPAHPDSHLSPKLSYVQDPP